MTLMAKNDKSFCHDGKKWQKIFAIFFNFSIFREEIKKNGKKILGRFYIKSIFRNCPWPSLYVMYLSQMRVFAINMTTPFLCEIPSGLNILKPLIYSVSVLEQCGYHFRGVIV